MAGLQRIGWTGALILLGATDVLAYNECAWLWYRAPGSSYYYTPAPVQQYYRISPYPPYCPVTPGVKIISLEGSRGKDARPIPAPPTPTSEPPLQKSPMMPPAKAQNETPEQRPTIITTRALAGGYVPGTTPVEKDRCRVGFWNLTGAELTLNVEGKKWTLAKDRSITMDLERSFAWQVNQRPQQVERIPEGQFTHEVVIRE